MCSVGFIPATPQNDAGRVIEPPVWLPSRPKAHASGHGRGRAARRSSRRALEVPGIASDRWIERCVGRRDRLSHDARRRLHEV